MYILNALREYFANNKRCEVYGYNLDLKKIMVTKKVSVREAKEIMRR